jgi:hypothetical protein
MVMGSVAMVVGLAACGSSSDKAATPSSTTGSSSWDGNGAPSSLITPATGTSLTAPARNSSFVCSTPIPTPTGLVPFPGVLTAGTAPWVSGNKVILSKMPAVPGSKRMTSVFKVATDGTTRFFKGNGIPSTPVGTFPIQSDSASYKYYAALPAQGYANAAEIPVQPYDLDVAVPVHPEMNATPSCIPALPTGVTLTGAVWHVEMAPDSQGHLYSPDSVLPLDTCQGHPYMGQYHYHGYSWKCFPKALQGTNGKQSPLMGYAIDGFGVYGPRGADGKVLTNAQLDVCHGIVSKVLFNGKVQSIYHYVLNNEYPYSIGCFRGTPAHLSSVMQMGNPPPSSSSSTTMPEPMPGMEG